MALMTTLSADATEGNETSKNNISVWQSSLTCSDIAGSVVG